ncbi:MAG: transcriptional repressor DicA [Tenericutes bacterium ADurb.BinA155]|nr:MAG: transcriptional repressor DicA [Tenericutes bacterium ADurb.BinA155]
MIGKQIKYYRTLAKMSQAELGEKVFVNRQAVSQWESGASYPEVETLIRLAKLFGITLDKLVLNQDDGWRVNITNGDCFNAFVKERFEENFVPFREAMIEGNTTAIPFSDSFDIVRAKFHETDVASYREHMAEFYALIAHTKELKEITLWFGEDTFCQMNLLSILAYLDRAGALGIASTIVIEDSSRKVIRPKEKVVLDSYPSKYIELMVKGKKTTFRDPFLNLAAADYLDLHDEQGTLAQAIKEKKGLLNKKEMAEYVWGLTRRYGLGDLQVYQLIERYTDYRYPR